MGYNKSRGVETTLRPSHNKKLHNGSMSYEYIQRDLKMGYNKSIKKLRRRKNLGRSFFMKNLICSQTSNAALLNIK